MNKRDAMRMMDPRRAEALDEIERIRAENERLRRAVFVLMTGQRPPGDDVTDAWWQLVEDKRELEAELERLRRERDEGLGTVQTELHSIPESSDHDEVCTGCYVSVVEPHTWADCVATLRTDRDAIVGSLCDAGFQRDEAIEALRPFAAVAYRYESISDEIPIEQLAHLCLELDNNIRAKHIRAAAELVRQHDERKGAQAPDLKRPRLLKVISELRVNAPSALRIFMAVVPWWVSVEEAIAAAERYRAEYSQAPELPEPPGDGGRE